MATAAAPQAAAGIIIHNNITTTTTPSLFFPFSEKNVNVNYYACNNTRRGMRMRRVNNLDVVMMSTSRGARTRSVAAAAAAGSYRRVPMDTPGAYELIDDETGHKFIVWGDDHDHDRLLSWTPPRTTTTNPQQHHQRESTPNSTTSASFRRLKAHKVNHLVRSITKSKQHLNNLNNLHRNGRALFHESNTSYVDLDSSTPSPPPMRDSMQPEDKTTATQSSSQDVSVSRPSDASLRGWGDGRISQRYSSKMDGLSNRLHKLNDKNNFFSRKTFKDLGCADYVIESLRAQHYPRPSHIQAMSFEPVIGGKSCIISDQSGSGKTLAYLLPLVQRLREEELQGLGKPLSLSPRVVILVPTAELASQVLNVCRSLSKSGVPFRSMVTTGGFRQRTQLENLRQELDVLIATPGRLLFLIKEGFLQLTNLKSAVLDEVDVLFNDEDFELALECLLNAAPVATQYIFVTATLPVYIYKKLIEAFPDSEVIMGPGIHRTSPGLEEILIDCSGDENSEKTPETAFLNKKNALLKLVEESPGSRTIIFCNKIETCRKVENMLKRLDRKGSYTRVLPFHAALDQKVRVANINEFHGSQSKNSNLFLVCTDRASRGIDFEGVDHVVLFDFPRDPSEYVRRVGRTARGAGGKGKAFIFVVGRQVSLARRIIERNRKGHPLHDVPCEFD